MSVYIRKALKEDFAAVANLYQQLADLHARARPDLYVAGTGVMPLSRFEKILASPDEQLFVAEENGAVIGAIQVIFKDLADRPSSAVRGDAEISVVVVDEKHQGHGVGRHMLEIAEGWAAKRGAEYVYLSTHAFNTGAQKSYRAAGYETESLNMGKFLKKGSPHV